MSDSSGIAKILLIKTPDEHGKYIVEQNALDRAIAESDDLSTIHIGNGTVDFSYIRANVPIFYADRSYFLMESDFYEYLEALKIRSVRYRDGWIREPDADSILTDAEKKLHLFESAYPGLTDFIESASSYDGDWREYSV